MISGSIGVRVWYQQQLRPLTSTSNQISVDIPMGYTISQIGNLLEEKKLIRSSSAFEWYIRDNNLRDSLKAGSYLLDSSLSTADIAKIIAGGKIEKRLFTILPGQRIDQIKSAMIKFGFDSKSVEDAFSAKNYSNMPALTTKPADASLEGYLYPESFESTKKTTPEDIIKGSLYQMAEKLKPDLKNKFQQNGLNTHQAITLASIVQQEVSKPTDMQMVARVFYNRLKNNMPLGSDVTYKYAAYISGQQPNPFIDSPYNTRKYPGLPPGPISNITEQALRAVANPAAHDYLFFVAGDDGKIYYSNTIEEHEALAKEHCKVLCSTY
jgi:UPF0755 protein